MDRWRVRAMPVDVISWAERVSEKRRTVRDEVKRHAKGERNGQEEGG